MARAMANNGVNPMPYLKQAKAIIDEIKKEKANPSDANVLMFPVQEFDDFTEYTEEEEIEDLTVIEDNVIVMQRVA